MSALFPLRCNGICAWGVEAGGELSFFGEEKKIQRLMHRELLFLEFIEGLAFYPQTEAQDWGPGFCQGRLPAELPWAAPHEQRETGGRPLWHLLNWGRWRGECVDAFTPPSGGAQQEPTEPTAPKSDFHTSSHPRTLLAPLAGGNRALSECGSGGWRGF